MGVRPSSHGARLRAWQTPRRASVQEQLDDRSVRGDAAAAGSDRCLRRCRHLCGVQRPGMLATIATNAQRVDVHISMTIPLTFMRLAGLSSATIEANGTAEPRSRHHRGRGLSGRSYGAQATAHFKAEDQTATRSRAQPIRPCGSGHSIWLFGIGLLLVVVSLALAVPRGAGSFGLERAVSCRGSPWRAPNAGSSRPQPTTVPVRVPTTAGRGTDCSFGAAGSDRATADRDASCYDGAHPGCTVRYLERRYAVPTVAPKLAAEVSDAYLRYFQVSADALLKLDSSRLADVATDGELSCACAEHRRRPRSRSRTKDRCPAQLRGLECSKR